MIQLTFELAMDFTFDLTLRPTYLDKQLDPEAANEEPENVNTGPENNFEPDCLIVLYRCAAEMISILIYCGMTLVLFMATF